MPASRGANIPTIKAYILKPAHRDFILSRICTLSTVKRERRVDLPQPSVIVQLIDHCSVKRLDDGIYHFAVHFAFRVWVPRCQG
jgi:hypothetical protein